MKISKAHKEFAYRLRFLFQISDQDVLNHPENYLGPNWDAVINFWLYLDTLTEDQLVFIIRHYGALSDKDLDIAWDNASVASATIKYGQDASNSAYYSVSYAKSAAEYATKELIGLDKLLEKGHQPVFFPLFKFPQPTNKL
jgi:hypothetical protein